VGGMMMLISERLRRNEADLRSIAGIDFIEPSPLIKTYFDLLRTLSSGIDAIYVQDLSRSVKAREALERIRPDFIFIDGDHALKGVMSDHMTVRKYAKILVHHDISSPTEYPDTPVEDDEPLGLLLPHEVKPVAIPDSQKNFFARQSQTARAVYPDARDGATGVGATLAVTGQRPRCS
jgi:hypothetical protein